MKKTIAYRMMVVIALCCSVILFACDAKAPDTSASDTESSHLDEPVAEPSDTPDTNTPDTETSNLDAPVAGFFDAPDAKEGKTEPNVPPPVWVVLRLDLPHSRVSEITIEDFDLTSYAELKEHKDFFTTPKGQNCVMSALEFFRYFILGDVSAMKECMIDPDYYEDYLFPEKERDLSEIEHLSLFKILFQSPDKISVEFEYAVADDHSFTYLGIDLRFENDEWRVRGFAKEK